MKIGDLVLHKSFKGAIGFVVNRATWTCEPVWLVYWIYHYYDTSCVSPVYDWEIEAIDESR